MIVVVTFYEENKLTKKKELSVSHGYVAETMKPVTLPGGHPYELGARFDRSLGEWVIDEKERVLRA